MRGTSVSASKRLACSIRQVMTYWWGASPVACLNRRAKWAGLACPTAASVMLSCGRAIFSFLRAELGFNTLSTSSPRESRSLLFQELVYYPCAAAGPGKTKSDSPEEGNPPSTPGFSLLLRSPVRWLWLVQGLVSETVSSHGYGFLTTSGAARLQCISHATSYPYRSPRQSHPTNSFTLPPAESCLLIRLSFGLLVPALGLASAPVVVPTP